MQRSLRKVLRCRSWLVRGELTKAETVFLQLQKVAQYLKDAGGPALPANTIKLKWWIGSSKKRVPVRNIRICSDKMWLRALTFMKCSEKINVDIKAPSLRGGRESHFDFVNMPTFLQFIKGSLQSSKRTNPVNSWEGMRGKIKSKYSHYYSQVNQSDAAVLLMFKGYFYQLCLIEWYVSTLGTHVICWHQAPILLYLCANPDFSPFSTRWQ